MEIKKITSNKYIDCNSYIVISENECIIIDPSFNFEEIIKYVKDFTVKYILLTHCHIDHIYDVKRLSEKVCAKVIGSKNLSINILNKTIRFDDLFNVKYEHRKIDMILEEEKNYFFGNKSFKIIETMGHTNCSICILIKDSLFSGDTIFSHGSHGRVNFITSNAFDMKQSIKKILNLDENIVVYPGHGENTTIKDYKRIYM
ncbi:MAG: MBL fold metallo-hydrolase [Bacilli bacterium]